MPGFARIDGSFSAHSWVASGHRGLRTRSPDQIGLRTSSLRTVGLRTLGRGHACRAPPSTAFTSKDTHCLAISHFGGQCASCSRRTSALEAVQLSAIPVKRTAAASDELGFFRGFMFGFRLGAVRHALTCCVFPVLLHCLLFGLSRNLFDLEEPKQCSAAHTQLGFGV